MLSAHQEGLWRVERIVRGSAFQHVASVHHIRGELDVPALERVIVLLGRRHELLHTGYRESHDELLAESTEPVPLQTHWIASDAAAAEFMQAEHDRPFALEGEPLFRPILVKTDTAYHLMLGLHHLICDAQSFSIVHRDLARLYALDAGIDDGPPPPALPTQYSDLARASTDAAARARAAAYWRDRLDGAREIRFRSASSGAEGERSFGTICVPVGASWRDAIADACRDQRSTPFLVFGAALLSVIAPRIEGTDLRLGTIFLNRLVPGADEVVGPFAEGLLLCVDVTDAGHAVKVLHDRLRDALLGAIDHSALAFDDLVESVEAAGLDREKLAPFTLSIASDPAPLELPRMVTEPAQPAEAGDGDGGVAVGLHVDLDLARGRCVATFDEAFVPEADVRVLISDALRRVEQWDNRREEAAR